MMTYHKLIFTTSIFLFALLAIVSATDYEYGSTQNNEKSKLEAEVDNKPYSTKPNYEAYKSKTDYEYSLTSEIEKPKFDTDYEPHFTKPNYRVPKPKINYRYGLVPNIEKSEPESYYKHSTKPDYEAPKPERNYGYSPTPKIEKSKSEVVYTPNPAKPNYEVSKSKTDYGYALTPKTEKSKFEEVYAPKPTKPDYEVSKPKLDIDYIPLPTKPYYEVPEPKESYQVQLPTVIGVQGTILCKSGSNYYPIQGAVARVKCECVNELGYETGPITVFSHVTDGKGYYFTTLSLPGLGSKLKINECKAYLESSPLETCKVPTDVNHGISGASLSSYRLLDNNFKLYSVAPFFCTSQAKSVPGY
ncbi:unnamed protein product [Vicia faba]|uniref:Uncharacterized protein n=1 Tax=Vicia faba TaxID=3906 RepID=A0AAV1A3K8_VICFA|nr:unnamed protein product [Vicia faba]